MSPRSDGAARAQVEEMWRKAVANRSEGAHVREFAFGPAELAEDCPGRPGTVERPQRFP